MNVPEQGYRSTKTKAADGVVVLPASDRVGSKGQRIRCAALDIGALPVVALGPKRRVEVLGEQLPLHYEFRRWAWRTERCVEIAIGRRALERREPGDVLEVGNVMPLAGHGGHTVVDKYEAGPGVLNEDVVDFVPGRTYDLVLSISTIEHVGWDEVPSDAGKAERALARMGELVAPGGALLVTTPVGYHPTLEQHFVSADAPFDSVELLVKTSRLASWTPRPLAEYTDQRYGAPYACGNAILVGKRGQPFASV